MTTLVIDPNTGFVRMATPKEIDKDIRDYNEEAKKVSKN